MLTSVFQPLPKKVFETLANKHYAHCVSIYLPMPKIGKEQKEHLAQANLKSCIKEVHKTLSEYQLHEDEINKYIKPIEELIINSELWRNPSEGLAIFLDSEELTYYMLPIPFETKTYVASHFYLKPLLPLYHENGIYYLLELSQDYVKLYEASKYSFKDLHLKSFAPDQLEKAVGFDYRPKMLQFRSGQDAFSSGSFHGHGEGKDDKKKELFTFFRAIDKGLMLEIKNHDAPLIIACVNELFNNYKEANTYPNLFNKNISGDPEFIEKNQLHKDSWKLIKAYFGKTKQTKLNQFTELYNTPKTSYQISDIIPAALNGKIDTLFVENNTDLYGTYNKLNGKIKLDKERKINNASLTNLTALKTFLQGGKVYLLDADEMPIKGRSLNALFRY